MTLAPTHRFYAGRRTLRSKPRRRRSRHDVVSAGWLIERVSSRKTHPKSINVGSSGDGEVRATFTRLGACWRYPHVGTFFERDPVTPSHVPRPLCSTAFAIVMYSGNKSVQKTTVTSFPGFCRSRGSHVKKKNWNRRPRAPISRRGVPPDPKQRSTKKPREKYAWRGAGAEKPGPKVPLPLHL